MRTTCYEIIHEVLRREGGFVHHGADRGGPTNMGVTLETMKRHSVDVDGDGDVDTEDVKTLPVQTAISIYKQRYWVPARAMDVPELIRELYMDMCVNHGTKNAILILQRAVETKGLPIDVDGIIGPQTITLSRVLTVKDLVYERLYFFSAIVHNDRSQLVFREGWFNRALEFL